MGINIKLAPDEIADFCNRWGVVELALFGSVLREEFDDDSDVDVLVRFAPGATPTLFDMVRMRGELEGVLGRKVDLVSRSGIERSRNYLRREAIVDTAEVVYEA